MPKQAVTRQLRILLALDEPTNPSQETNTEMVRLYQAAKGLAVAQKAESLTVLGLVQLPHGQSLSEGTLAVQAQRTLLNDIVNAPGPGNAKPSPSPTTNVIVRVTSEANLAQELNDAIIEQQTTQLLLGWQWFENESGQKKPVGRGFETAFVRPGDYWAGRGFEPDPQNYVGSARWAICRVSPTTGK